MCEREREWAGMCGPEQADSGALVGSDPRSGQQVCTFRARQSRGVLVTTYGFIALLIAITS